MLDKNKKDRLLKLKMIKSTDIIRNELKKRKLKFTEEICGLFNVTSKNRDFRFQIDDGETITSCWTNLSDYSLFDLCEYGTELDEFIMNLDDIIEDVEKLYKLKDKIEKQIKNIAKTVLESNIHGLEINDGFFDDLSFENLVLTQET